MRKSKFLAIIFVLSIILKNSVLAIIESINLVKPSHDEIQHLKLLDRAEKSSNMSHRSANVGSYASAKIHANISDSEINFPIIEKVTPSKSVKGKPKEKLSHSKFKYMYKLKRKLKSWFKHYFVKFLKKPSYY